MNYIQILKRMSPLELHAHLEPSEFFPEPIKSFVVDAGNEALLDQLAQLLQTHQALVTFDARSTAGVESMELRPGFDVEVIHATRHGDTWYGVLFGGHNFEGKHIAVEDFYLRDVTTARSFAVEVAKGTLRVECIGEAT